jgi:hypothetical protein
MPKPITLKPRPDPRQHEYRIVEVWGFEDYEGGPPVKVGDVILDRWKGRGEQPWTVYNFTTMEPVGGWQGYYLGRKGSAVDGWDGALRKADSGAATDDDPAGTGSETS